MEPWKFRTQRQRKHRNSTISKNLCQPKREFLPKKRCPVTQIQHFSDSACFIQFDPSWSADLAVITAQLIKCVFLEDFQDLNDGTESRDTFYQPIRLQ